MNFGREILSMGGIFLNLEFFDMYVENSFLLLEFKIFFIFLMFVVMFEMVLLFFFFCLFKVFKIMVFILRRFNFSFK